MQGSIAQDFPVNCQLVAKQKRSTTWVHRSYAVVGLCVSVLLVGQHLPLHTMQDTATLTGALLFSTWMLIAHKRDILSREIPTGTTAFLLLVLSALTLIAGNDLFIPIVTGLFFGGSALTVVLLSKERYMGMGDVHVLTVAAFTLGPHMTLLCLLLGGYLSGVRFVVQKNNVLPFGADLAFAAISLLLLRDIIEPWLILVR